MSTIEERSEAIRAVKFNFKEFGEIERVIEWLSDNPDEAAAYIVWIERRLMRDDEVLFRAIGWAHADACLALDRGDDPRNMEVPDMIERAKHDLGHTPEVDHETV